MDEVWRRIERWLKSNAVELLRGLADGASEQEINRLEVAIDAQLPEDMKASYRICGSPFRANSMGLSYQSDAQLGDQDV